MEGRPRIMRRPDLGEWADRAACRRPGAPSMFPDNVRDEARACIFCRTFCPVVEECGDYGLSQGFGTAGIYGARTESQRERMLRRRRRQPA